MGAVAGPEARVASQVAILTGGYDRPYALGLASSLIAEGVSFDFIGSDFLEAPELRESPNVRVLNLRGDVRPETSLRRRAARLVMYYARLLLYAATAEPRTFHILWNNKVEIFDRTVLMIYYRMLGKRIIFTVHNVNVRKRDGNDSALNRLTLRIQYKLVHHFFVHTERMKRDLQSDFNVLTEKISVIPFGINNTVPDTALTGREARVRLGLDASNKTALFFGNIAPYKGLEYLVEAMAHVTKTLAGCQLIIAGRPKGPGAYWAAIERRIETLQLRESIIERIEYISDADTEMYFKAADVLVLPYIHVFQSGVLFLSYNFGLPVIATDVGSLREDIAEGKTGFVCKPCDAIALADAMKRYFASDLYRELASRRQSIRHSTRERYSWAKVASVTNDVYRTLSCQR